MLNLHLGLAKRAVCFSRTHLVSPQPRWVSPPLAPHSSYGELDCSSSPAATPIRNAHTQCTCKTLFAFTLPEMSYPLWSLHRPRSHSRSSQRTPGGSLTLTWLLRSTGSWSAACASEYQGERKLFIRHQNDFMTFVLPAGLFHFN